MTIGTAIQKGTIVRAYDEKGRQTCAVPSGFGPKDGLHGYTGSAFSVRRGSLVYTFDENGRQRSVISAK